MDRQKYQVSGLKWLYEMQVLDDPQLVNNMKLNILMVSSSIRETEFLIFQEKKQMLVYLDLTWFGRKFRKERIVFEVEDMLSQLLPSFKFRITDDISILLLAIEKVKQAVTGGKKNETLKTSDSVSGNILNGNGAEASTSNKTETVASNAASSSEADPEKQPKD
jgi:hypothetical protein